MKETDNEDLTDPEKSEIAESDAIRGLDVSYDAGRENTPADQVAVDESLPKEDQSGDAKGRN